MILRMNGGGAGPLVESLYRILFYNPVESSKTVYFGFFGSKLNGPLKRRFLPRKPAELINIVLGKTHIKK